MDTIKAIYGRRSIRKFEDKPVDRDTLIELCRLGAAAPSAANRIPWEFIVVDEVAYLDKIRQTMRYGNFNAPAAIVVCGNMDRAFPDADSRDFWVQDTSAAMENILVGAWAMGLGTVWLGVSPVPSNVSAVREMLHIPNHLIPMGIAYVGYPAETKEPRTQLKDDWIHFNGIYE